MASIQCDRDTFLRYLQQSGLLQPREFRKAVGLLPPSDRGRVVARALVEAGLLTRFQAELLLIGRTHGFFLGQYKILDQLGQGGMGRVYKAVHMTMRRVVALKVLSPQVMQTAKAMKMFKHEVRAAAQLHHPNIVTAFDANQIKGRHYLVMEYVDGPSLDQLVRQRNHLPSGLACEIIRQAAMGLQYAHELGVVHRDIKPANLLVQKPKRANAGMAVKILDFGLARLHETDPHGEQAVDVPRDNTILGTPDFLSPEQSRNSPGVDSRSDTYSLGCTFYYLLTGRVPFPGGSTLEKLLRHSNETPVTVELFRSDVPAEVLSILNRMMAKKPEDRFQSPQELVQALTPFASVTAADLELSVPKQAIAKPSLPSSGGLELEPKQSSQGPTSVPQATEMQGQPAPPASDDDLPFPFAPDVEPRPGLPAPLWLLIALAAVTGGLGVAALILLAR